MEDDGHNQNVIFENKPSSIFLVLPNLSVVNFCNISGRVFSSVLEAIPEKKSSPIPIPVLGVNSIPILNSHGHVGFQFHQRSIS